MNKFLLCKLLKVARDEVFDNLLKNQKGNRAFKLSAMDMRHKRAEDIHDVDILEVEEKSELEHLFTKKKMMM